MNTKSVFSLARSSGVPLKELCGGGKLEIITQLQYIEPIQKVKAALYTITSHHLDKVSSSSIWIFLNTACSGKGKTRIISSNKDCEEEEDLGDLSHSSEHLGHVLESLWSPRLLYSFSPSL